MNRVYLIGILLMNILLLSSCDKEASNMHSDPEELHGTWFRSYANKVWGGHNQPSFERGESHITITFGENGEFIHNKTVLGIYEGTTMEDTSAIIIVSGTFKTENETIDITLDKRIWWDSYYEDMQDFEESFANPDKYIDVTFEIINEDLKLIYFIETDLITDEQEVAGLDKFEELYTRQ